MDTTTTTTTTTTTADPAPDWTTTTDTVACPLCGYDLRGLTDPRCPECGFAFRWAELSDARRTLHPYLFEHHRRHNVWSFWTTYWRTCRPRRFWRDLSPAHPVRTGRLLVYAVLVALPVLALPLASLPAESAALTREVERVRSAYRPGPAPGTWIDIYSAAAFRRNGLPPPVTTTAALDQLAPPVGSASYWQTLWDRHSSGRKQRAVLTVTAAVLIWPCATLAALQVFQTSLQWANIDRRHVVRAALYGCDFGLLIVVGLAVGSWGLSTVWADQYGPVDPDSVYVLAVLACPIVATYRLTFAYGRYLRFHLPFVTVLVSQVVTVLFVAVVMSLLRSPAP